MSTLGAPGGEAQSRLIQASVNAGVKRFIPSEFGADPDDEHVETFPNFGFKVAAQKQLKAAAEKKPDFTYTLISTGPFLDWCISTFPLLIDVKGRKIDTYDGGDIPFSTTRVTTVGKAVVASLKNYEATKNRVVKVHDAVITQNQLKALAETEVGSSFSGKDNDTKAIEKSAWEKYKDNSVDPNPMSWIIPFILVSIWGYGGTHFDNTENELLGIPELKGKELDQLLTQEIQKVSK